MVISNHLQRGSVVRLDSEMLPNYDDFLIKRFEQPDEVRTFEKGKFEMVKIGSMTVAQVMNRDGNGRCMWGRQPAPLFAKWNMSGWSCPVVPRAR